MLNRIILPIQKIGEVTLAENWIQQIYQWWVHAGEEDKKLKG
jgi:hypothetical protein